MDDEVGDTGGPGDVLGPGGPGCDENWVAIDGEAPPAPANALPEFQAMAASEPAGVVDASAFTAALPSVLIPEPPAREPMNIEWDAFVETYATPWPGGWLIDGDQFVTTQQLRDLHRLFTSGGTTSETGLLALNDDIFDEVWSEPRKLELTWCVGFVFPQPNNEDNTELHQERYERILAGMEHSTKAWERATGVNFVHLAEFDDPPRRRRLRELPARSEQHPLPRAHGSGHRVLGRMRGGHQRDTDH